MPLPAQPAHPSTLPDSRASLPGAVEVVDVMNEEGEVVLKESTGLISYTFLGQNEGSWEGKKPPPSLQSRSTWKRPGKANFPMGQGRHS